MWPIIFSITIGCVTQTADAVDPEPDRTETTARTNQQPHARPTRAERLCAFMEPSSVESLRECVTKLDPAGIYTPGLFEAILSVRRKCKGGGNKDPDVQRCLVAVVDEELKHRQSVIQNWPARPSRPGPGDTPFDRVRWLTTTMKRFLGEDKDNGPNGNKASPAQESRHPSDLDCSSVTAAQLERDMQGLLAVRILIRRIQYEQRWSLLRVWVVPGLMRPENRQSLGKVIGNVYAVNACLHGGFGATYDGTQDRLIVYIDDDSSGGRRVGWYTPFHGWVPE